MAKEHEIKKALGGKKEGKREGPKLHTHGVHYERAGNGGVIAHVHRHTGTPGSDHAPHHMEEHVLPDVEAAQEHMQEHMGDQPAAGEMESQEAAPAPPEQGGGAAGMM
ncbi:MAG TPA: hypothetical protein VL498_07085 [Terracidiphilus sp.]|jgi:hypothetical protein|nr:hypothetical protein [Terracidiphilus sp.]